MMVYVDWDMCKFQKTAGGENSGTELYLKGRCQNQVRTVKESHLKCKILLLLLSSSCEHVQVVPSQGRSNGKCWFFLLYFFTRASSSSDGRRCYYGTRDNYFLTLQKTLCLFFMLEISDLASLSLLQNFTDQVKMSDYETQLKENYTVNRSFFCICYIYFTSSPPMFIRKRK